MKKKHVMFILSSFNIGGAEVDVKNLAAELIARGYRVTVVSRGGVLEKELPRETRTLHLPIASSSWPVSSWNKLRILIYSLLHGVTHLNPQSIKGVLNSVPAKRFLRIPLIATIHNLVDASWLQRSAQLLNRVTDVNLFVSEYERQKFIKAGLRSEISRVVYSGIDPSRFAVDYSQTRAAVIGMVGRLHKEKGFDLGIQAFAGTAGQYPQTRLIIVGDGPERQELEKLARRLGVASRVEFTGTRVDISRQLSRIDFLVLPSLTESLSLAAREAMAAGKPVIASNVGGMAELIIHRENGLLVPAGNIKALAKAMVTWLQDPNKMHNCGKLARKRIEDDFSLTGWAEKMDALYCKANGEPIPRTSVRRNILYVTTRFPLPTVKGDKTRAYHQVRELSRWHNIFLLSLMESKSDEKYLPGITGFCQAVVTVLLSPERARHQRWLSHFSLIPSQVAYFYNREFKKLLPKIILARDIDTVYCLLIRAAQYAGKVTNAWKIIDFVDAFSLDLQRKCRYASLLQKFIFYPRRLKVKLFEQKMLKIFNRALIISESDRNALGDQRILVVPNGVHRVVKPVPVDTVPGKAIIFSGNMDYWPNEDAVKYLVNEILPHLSPEVTLYIVGINNNPRVWKYAGGRVIVTGEVESIAEYLHKVKVAVCPMRLGAGQQSKILEAMAAGIPVVATAMANSGIGAPAGCLCIEDEPEAFARAINKLLENPALRLQMRERALEFITRHFDWARIIETMEQKLWTVDKTGIPVEAVPVLKPARIDN